MGAVAVVALPAVLGQGGPKVCRRGHPLEPANVRRTARGEECMTCYRSRKPAAVLVCQHCATQFVRTSKSASLKFCEGCETVKRPSPRRPRRSRADATRTCVTCHERRDLDEFTSDAAGQRGQPQYMMTCEECRTQDSPFAVAKRQVERIFGIPSSEWMNRGRHPLNVLHHARMVSINNARGNPYIAVRPTWDTMTAWRLIKRAGLTRRQRAAA